MPTPDNAASTSIPTSRIYPPLIPTSSTSSTHPLLSYLVSPHILLSPSPPLQKSYGEREDHRRLDGPPPRHAQDATP
ncbi:hypothetical protein SprV_0100201000 [Sparganum proliferum]